MHHNMREIQRICVTSIECLDGLVCYKVNRNNNHLFTKAHGRNTWYQ